MRKYKKMINVDYKKVIDKFKFLSIQNYFRYVIENNPGNNNPYHNLNHTLQLCYLLIESGAYNAKQLLIAALFHDFGHSAGKENDEVNVNIAVDNYKKAVEVLEISKYGESMTSYQVTTLNNDMETIEKLIRATQYPYVIEDKDLTDDQKLFRDCDLVVCMCSDFIPHTTIGLMKELNMSLEDYIEKEKIFLSNNIFKLRTDFGKKIYFENIRSLSEELEALAKILN